MNNTNPSLRDRMMILAGITQDKTLATMNIPNVDRTIEFDTIPNWFDKLRYKICGFNLRVIRTQPKTITKSRITLSTQQQLNRYYFGDEE